MTLYQRKLLSNDSDIGEPGPLPADLVGLADESLADLSWVAESQGYAGSGFFTVAEPPPSVRLITTRDFMRRLTSAELLAIETAAETNAQIRVLLRLLYAGPTVNLDVADTVSALAYLTGLGLLASGRSAEIRA